MSNDLATLIASINTLGFEVSLRPIGAPAKVTTTVAKVAPAPAPAKPKKGRKAKKGASLADRIAPHGYDASGEPLAPFGFCSDGVTPRKSAAGRPAGAKNKATVEAESLPVKPASKPAALPKVKPAGVPSLDLSALMGKPSAPDALTDEDEAFLAEMEAAGL